MQESLTTKAASHPRSLHYLVKLLFLLPVLSMLPGCMTDSLLREIPWETDVWREMACSSRSVHQGHDAGVVTLGYGTYRDYRFAGCLVGNGKVRTLRVLVPIEPHSVLPAMITESDEPVPKGHDVSITLAESNYYERTEVWRGYFSRTGRRATGAPALAIHLPRHGNASLFYDRNEAGDRPQIEKLPTRNELQFSVRSSSKSAMQHALLPAAILGDAGVIGLYVLGGGWGPPPGYSKY